MKIDLSRTNKEWRQEYRVGGVFYTFDGLVDLALDIVETLDIPEYEIHSYAEGMAAGWIEEYWAHDAYEVLKV